MRWQPALIGVFTDVQRRGIAVEGGRWPLKADGSRVVIDKLGTSSVPLWDSPPKQLDNAAILLEKLHGVVGPRPLDALDAALLGVASDDCSAPAFDA